MKGPRLWQAPRRGAGRRLLARLARVALLCLLLLLVLAATFPLLVGGGLGRGLLQAAGRLLGVHITVDRVTMDYAGDLVLTGLRLAPAAGPGPAVAAARAVLGLAPASLLAGRVRARLEVRGLRATLPAGAGLAAAFPAGGGGRGRRPRRPPALRLDLLVEDAEIRILDAEGALAGLLRGRLEGGNAAPGGPLRLAGSLELLETGGGGNGTLSWAGEAALDGGEGRLAGRGRELPLAPAGLLLLGARAPAGLGGTADLEVDILLSGNKLTGRGEAGFRRPAAVLPGVGPPALQLEGGALRAELALELGGPPPDLSSLAGHLGPLRLRGLSPEEANRLLGSPAAGLEGELELAELPVHPRLLPRGTVAAGRLTLAGAAGPAGRALRVTGGELAARGPDWGLTGLEVAVQARWEAAGGLPVEGGGRLCAAAVTAGPLRLAEMTVPLALAGGTLAAGPLAGTLNGGTLTGEVRLEPGDETLPFRFSGGVAGAALAEPLAPFLAPVLPFLITAATTGLAGRLDASAEGMGRLRPTAAAGAGPALAGRGRLALADLAFLPDPRLEPLLGPLCRRGGCRVARLASTLRLDGEGLHHEEARFGGEEGELLVRGRTGPEGELDYRFDASPLLGMYTDGRSLLAALGGARVPQALRGTLDRPAPAAAPLDVERLLGAPASAPSGGSGR